MAGLARRLGVVLCAPPIGLAPRSDATGRLPRSKHFFTGLLSLDELAQRASELGGNAVVGIDLDYEVLGAANGMLMVSASGTAVVI